MDVAMQLASHVGRQRPFHDPGKTGPLTKPADFPLDLWLTFSQLLLFFNDRMWGNIGFGSLRATR